MGIGAQGAITLLMAHDPGVLRHLPGGVPVQLVVYVAIALSGLSTARRNRVHPDPEHDPRGDRHR
jgi:hypothetical protein